MAIDFSEILVIAVSSRALFNLERENTIFENQGLEDYSKFQLENEEVILQKGTAYPLIEALLNLNTIANEKVVEVVIMSKNSPDTGMRILNSIQHYGIDITRSVFTGGEDLACYLDAFSVDLFLTKHESDVQAAIDSEHCAAAIIYDYPKEFEPHQECVRIAFDADAVVFSDESEHLYKTKGLEEFLKHEELKVDLALSEGPFAKLIKTLSKIQKKIGLEKSPIRLAIVTARNSPAHLRVIKTLRKWGVYIDSAFFLGGVSKDKILKAFRPHIFFDDQEVHAIPASQYVPSSKVPYKSKSPLRNIDVNKFPPLAGEGNAFIPE